MAARLQTVRSERAAIRPANGREGRAEERFIVIELNRPSRDLMRVCIKAEAVSPPAVPIAGGGTSILRLADLLLTWLRRADQRRQLGSVSDRMLKDIGVSRADVDYEISRRFWQD